MLNYFATPIEEAGEKGLFSATSGKYPPADGREGDVEVLEGAQVAKSSIVVNGKRNGVYRLGADCESVENECDKVLEEYRGKGVGKTVWEETLKVWEMALTPQS